MEKSINNINFRNIAAFGGDERKSFEEFCCQLARRTVEEDSLFNRLRGEGGDGGVECFADTPDRGRVGWQAKYVFDIGRLLRQADKSLATALRVHPTLTKYVLCFPFDPTGPTERKGRSGLEKLNEWREKKTSAAGDRKLDIEFWPQSKLLELLLCYDVQGGIREFFFNETVLSDHWFSKHLESVKATAGPRYTPEPNIRTELTEWLDAFGRTPAWSGEFEKKIRGCREACDSFAIAIGGSGSDTSLPKWPEELCEPSRLLADDVEKFFDECVRITESSDSELYESLKKELDCILQRFNRIESQLADDLKAGRGKGADSPGFRQYMAEYMVSFPAANLDVARKAIKALENFRDVFCSPSCALTHKRAFVLAGAAGSGKTHGMCDIANLRSEANLRTCVVFGDQFEGGPVTWKRLSEILSLPATSEDGILDALNAAGEASGSPLILCIDAINETRSLKYWRNHLPAFVRAMERRSYLRLCVTCRTSFRSYCLPDDHGLQVVQHEGFSGMEHIACREFFEHYGLTPPVAPILQPEFSNPLYLRLLCKTLESRGLSRIPAGWKGLSPVIMGFLEEKEKQFSKEHEMVVENNIVMGSLMAISKSIADSEKQALSFSEAGNVVLEARPQIDGLQVVEWLLKNDLLFKEAPASDDISDEEGSVKPAFERLGDFLIADALLEKCKQGGVKEASKEGEVLHGLLNDPDKVGQNVGVLAALSIIIPERNPRLEMPDLTDNESARRRLASIAVESFSFRDPDSFSHASKDLILEELGRSGRYFDVMDVVLTSCWQTSAVDAVWLDEILKRKPLSRRDAFWCRYLHERFENKGTVRRLIDAAFELPLDRVETYVAERWATVLLWFTAAADRRVKDNAMRAATAILTSRPEVMKDVLQRLLESDDDEIKERALLSCYGALIVSRDAGRCSELVTGLMEAFGENPAAFDNALIRDNIRCIFELSKKLDPGSGNIDPKLSMSRIGSDWPLDVPSDDDVEAWKDMLNFRTNHFGSDFFIYSMRCLEPWRHAVSKVDMAKWMLKRIAKDFGYEGSGCEKYDRYMLSKYGGGRSKPGWAERIGKKYQWTAMYQLASRLHDNVKRDKEQGSRFSRESLILVEARKIDPTLSHKTVRNEDDARSWWIKPAAEGCLNDGCSDDEWSVDTDGIPRLRDFLSATDRGVQGFQLLLSDLSWTNRDKDMEPNAPYRVVWIMIRSYLVRRPGLSAAYDRLRGCNFFGRWMPEPDPLLYGFAGEYPWAPAFGADLEEWNYEDQSALPAVFKPSWNQLLVEWEYDTTMPRRHIAVPSNKFFSRGDLWWNGRDGYALADGTVVFRDPSVTKPGPQSLLADLNELEKRLKELNMGIIWTMLVEKMVLGRNGHEMKFWSTFSQRAYMDEDDSIRSGRLVLFKDREKNAGPRDSWPS